MALTFPPPTERCSGGILNAIGNTPLVTLSRYLDRTNVKLFAKLEAANPGGSAKDRPALLMIETGLRSGAIRSGTTIVESSSGNMGIGLAQACRYHGLPFICVVDPNAQAHNLGIMRALGADVRVVTNPENGDFLTARLTLVRQLLETIPNAFWPNQYQNLQNPCSHQVGTIREIDEALKGQLDYLFVATSSTGTARGCQAYLREHKRKTRVIAVDAQGSVLFDGSSGPRRIPGLGAGTLPPLAEGQVFDEVHRVSDIDCVVGCRRMAEREAMLVGGSAGGVLETVRRLQYQLAGRTVAVILHDSGVRYLDTIFSERWVKEALDADPEMIQDRVSAISIHRPLSASA